MAVVKGICCVVPMFMFMCCFVSVVIAAPHNSDFSNPSIHLFDNFLSGDVEQYEESQKLLYHVYKRSATFTNKKAFENPKKVIVKTASSNIDKALSKHFMENKSAVEINSTIPPKAVILVNSTSVTNLPEDKYNASVSSTSSTVLPSSSSPVTNASTTVTTVSISSTVNASSAIDSATAPVTTTTTNNATSPLTTASTEVLPTKPPGMKNNTDDHVYYTSLVIEQDQKAMSYRVDFEKLPKDKVIIHRMLSDSHRRAATVTLSFDFPFYGHPIRNITIATGGFLYMGDYMHSWLAATQYVAPLMANFDTSLSNESTVRFFDNGTAFVIEWKDVSLQDRNLEEKFTFQAILLKSGDIIFVYESIPLSVNDIGDESHPVKVGLSDAYVIDRVIYFIRRKTIYEYHRIDMKRDEISNHTAIYFTALPTCPSFSDCESCMAANATLECLWCNAAKRCSNGLDRRRQDWLQLRCDVERSKVDCSLKPSPNWGPYVQPMITDTPSKTYTTLTPISSNDIMHHPASAEQSNVKSEQATNFDGEISQSAQVDVRQGNFSIGGVVAVLLLVALALGTLAWVGYAYRNPHTSSGQLLIKYRPSQWRFRSGEARYTAASVHM